MCELNEPKETRLAKPSTITNNCRRKPNHKKSAGGCMGKGVPCRPGCDILEDPGYLTSSHRHGSQKWVPPIVVTFHITIYHFHDSGRKSVYPSAYLHNLLIYNIYLSIYPSVQLSIRLSLPLVYMKSVKARLRNPR